MARTDALIVLGSSLLLLGLGGCSRTEAQSPKDAGAATAASPKSVTITIRGMAFDPPVAEAPLGSTIVWKNEDIVEHTATAEDKTFDSGRIASQRTWSYSATKAGNFPYACTLHPTMKGTLVIK